MRLKFQLKCFSKRLHAHAPHSPRRLFWHAMYNHTFNIVLFGEQSRAKGTATSRSEVAAVIPSEKNYVEVGRESFDNKSG